MKRPPGRPPAASLSPRTATSQRPAPSAVGFICGVFPSRLEKIRAGGWPSRRHRAARSAPFDNNTARSGNGGTGTYAGEGLGGAVYGGGTATFTNCAVTGNRAVGGSQDTGEFSGEGCGGGVYCFGNFTFAGTSFENNQSEGGKGSTAGSTLWVRSWGTPSEARSTTPPEPSADWGTGPPSPGAAARSPASLCWQQDSAISQSHTR